MTSPDLHESALRRAYEETLSLVKTRTFDFVLFFFAAISGLSIFLVADDNDKILVAVLALLVTPVALVVLTFLAWLVSAPYVQRNELRRSWPAGDSAQVVNVDVEMKRLALKGIDKCKHFEHFGYARNQTAWIDEWSDEVARFLGQSAPEDATEFLNSARETKLPLEILRERSQKLDEMADRRLSAAA